MTGSGIVGIAVAVGLAVGLGSVLVPLMTGAADSYEIADSLLWMGGLGAFLGLLAGLVTASLRSAQRR